MPEDGSLPHCQKYDRMYPLWVGRGRGAVSLERLLIGEWRWDPRCLNIGPGGEGVSLDSPHVSIYVCLKDARGEGAHVQQERP